jgi:hypothetical protein
MKLFGPEFGHEYTESKGDRTAAEEAEKFWAIAPKG